MARLCGRLAYFGRNARAFLLARPDVVSEEGTPWQENGQTWRRLQIRFPANIATHNTNQTLYIDGDGLLKRHDYDVDISGGTQAVHYMSEYREAGGFRFPTKHVPLRCRQFGNGVGDACLATRREVGLTSLLSAAFLPA
jgi:hypothetical protein